MKKNDSSLDTAMAAAVAAIEAADTIGVLGHIGPDGDALGASWGLAIASRNNSKTAVASFGEPFVVPSQFRFLSQDVVVPAKDFPTGLDVVVACDTAAPSRLGSLEPAARSARTLIVIDHHISNEGFGDIQLIDPGAAATAEIVYRLLGALGWTVTHEVADCLYTGLVTDTGRFQYSNTTPAVHQIAADLIAAGVQPDIVGRHVYEEFPFGYLKVVGAVMGRSVLDADRKLVWSTVTSGDLDKAGISYEDADGLIDILRTASESEVALLIKQLDGSPLKGSLRSRGMIDVSAIAALFGGGGHHNASGFTTSQTLDEVMAAVLEHLDGVT